ncbi:MAG: response regulator transcription factor [Planctomycetota bacterium]|nr:response regulator transcription factor [Planctomycetota bacterium]
MRVLIADDDPVYQILLEDLLKQWGFDVVVTGDGSEAYQAIRQDKAIKLAILDWMMPGTDGYAVCRLIKEDQSRQNVYIIMLTGDRLKDDIVKVLVAGADDYLIKPFEPLDLKIRLHTARRILDLQAEVAELRQSAQKQPAY